MKHEIKMVLIYASKYLLFEKKTVLFYMYIKREQNEISEKTEAIQNTKHQPLNTTTTEVNNTNNIRV